MTSKNETRRRRQSRGRVSGSYLNGLNTFSNTSPGLDKQINWLMRRLSVSASVARVVAELQFGEAAR